MKEDILKNFANYIGNSAQNTNTWMEVEIT